MKMDSHLYSSTPSESFTHKAIKRLIYKYISSNCSNIKESSLEKNFKTRRADVYFKLQTGERIAVEIQNSFITVKEIMDRTRDYNKKGINVLWILNGKGNTVGDLKYPQSQKKLRISPAEHLLHKIYGGRVYYVNLKHYLQKFVITPPYALHFSPCNKIPTSIFQDEFDYFFIRNTNYVPIPNWDLICVDYRYKVARFFDKNAVNILKEKVRLFLHKKELRSCENCRKRFKSVRFCKLNSQCDFRPYQNMKLLNIILSKFDDEYDTSMIFNALYKLSYEDDVRIKDKIIRKGYDRYY